MNTDTIRKLVKSSGLMYWDSDEAWTSAESAAEASVLDGVYAVWFSAHGDVEPVRVLVSSESQLNADMLEFKKKRRR